jgi:TRAP transporter 4TM/12TM fusion protein
LKSSNRILSLLSSGVALLMVFYHLLSSQTLLLPSTQHFTAHLGFALVVIFLGSLESNRKIWQRIVLSLFVLLSFVCWGYIHVLHEALIDRSFFNTLPDLIIGAILVFLVLEAARESFGLVIPILALVFIIFPFFGAHLPGPLKCTSMTISQTIGNLSVSLDHGIYQLLSISLSYVFLFVVFGGVLQATGAVSSFLQLGKMIGSKVRAGPAMMSVIASAAVGSVSGSFGANIAITGSFTIPLMKTVGYEPHQAGAIEASASSGGAIMPPVMGVIAFVMAGVTGIPYIKICAMALLPAILYFGCCGLYVYLRGEQRRLPKKKATIDTKELFYQLPLFLGPLALIVILLICGFSVMYTAVWAIISTVVLTMIRKKTRPSLRQYIDGFVQGARNGAGIAAMISCSGILMATFTMTGLGIKIAHGIETWSGGNLLLALAIIWAICIILGMGGQALAGYVIVTIFGVPALMDMGLTLEMSHFFVLFGIAFGVLTPPIAMAAIIASKLAGAPYMKTSIEATKVAIAAFVVPFLFIYCPVLLLNPQETLSAINGIIASVLILSAFQVSFVGYLFTDCNKKERTLPIIGATLLLVYVITKSLMFFSAGILILAIFVFVQLRKRKAVESIA